MAEKEQNDQPTFTLSDLEQQILSNAEKLARYHRAVPPKPRGSQESSTRLTEDEMARVNALPLKERLNFLRGAKGPKLYPRDPEPET